MSVCALTGPMPVMEERIAASSQGAIGFDEAGDFSVETFDARIEISDRVFDILGDVGRWRAAETVFLLLAHVHELPAAARQISEPLRFLGWKRRRLGPHALAEERQHVQAKLGSRLSG